MSNRIVVTGASGHLGRAIVEHLLTSQNVASDRIIAATRDPARLADLAARGIEVRHADFSDPASLPAAFADAGQVLILSTDTNPGAGTRAEQHKAAIGAAKAAGAARILYTSMPSPTTSAIVFAFEHLASEEALKASGVDYTIFRNGWYQEDLFMSLPQALKSGKWFTSAGHGRVAYGARDDYAAAIAASLTANLPGSREHTLTGPQAVTMDEVAALAVEILRRPIDVVQISDAALAEGLRQAGLPEPVIAVVVSIDTNTREGHIDMATDDVATLSGRKPKTLRTFFEENRAAFLG